MVLARGLLGLVLSAIAGFVAWMGIWPYVLGPALSEPRFVITLALVIGTPSGLVTALLWRNSESPPRIRWLFALVSLAVAVATPCIVMLVKDVHTYYALFGGAIRLPVIDVADALFTMLVSSAVAANVVSGALATYRMARYREI